MGLRTARWNDDARYNPLHGARNQLHGTWIVICATSRRAGAAVRSWTRDPVPAVRTREEPEPHRERPRRRPPRPAAGAHPPRRAPAAPAARRRCGRPATRRPGPASASASPPTSPPPRRASPAAGPPSRWSATPRSCRSAQRRDDIAAALRDAQVVVVAGETGSGKTTQLPKIALELGRGRARPDRAHPAAPDRRPQRGRADRRGARTPRWARSSASRCGSPTTSRDDTLVKLMTDGVLLAEIAHDRLLRQYDTIILDEAHERSLNIDFLLGYLAQLLPRRPDLKLVITSATIDVERVARALRGRAGRRGQRAHLPGRGPLPPGRRPRRPGRRSRPRPGQRDPRRRRRARRRGAGRHPGVPRRRAGDPRHRRTRWPSAALPSTEIVPLYSRLSAADQHKVFAPHTGRRIVLATNVAETSLTVPGIRYVDRPRARRGSPGTAIAPRCSGCRSSRSARPRPGSGRAAAGGSARASRSGCTPRPTSTAGRSSPTRRSCAPTSPRCCCRWPRSTSATSRTSRSSTRRTAAPSPTALAAARGAAAPSTSTGSSPTTGRALAALPLDPRMARMVVEADRRGVLDEVLVIAAGLTIQDPRERPTEHQQAADQLHARFADENSDFLALLNLWRYLGEQQDALSRQPVPPHGEAGVPALPAHPRVAGPARPAARHRPPAGHDASASRPPSRTSGASPPRCWPGCSPTSACRWSRRRAATASRAAGPGVPRHPQHPVRDRARARRWRRSRRAGWSPPSWSRPAGCSPAPSPGSTRRRSRSWPSTWSSGSTPSRGGTPSAAPSSPPSGSPSTGCRSSSAGGCSTARSTRSSPASCSSGTPWCRASGRRTTASGPTTSAPSSRSPRWRSGPAAATSASTTRRVFELYDARIPADVVSTRHFDRWWKAARREQPGPAHLHPGDAHQRRGGRAGAGRGLSRRGAAHAGADPAAVLRVRARARPRTASPSTSRSPSWTASPRRRRGSRWPSPCPGLREELVTALLRTPAQAAAPRAGADPRPGARGAAAHRPGRAAAAGAGARAAPGDRGRRSRPTPGRPDQVPDHLRATFRVLDDQQRPLAIGKDLAALQGAGRAEGAGEPGPGGLGRSSAPG